MRLIRGPFGDFHGCTRYPVCRHTVPVGIGINCPRCQAPVVERIARKSRKPFWPCSRRECGWVAWERPHTCSACGAGCFGAERPRRDVEAAADPTISQRAADDSEEPF